MSNKIKDNISNESYEDLYVSRLIFVRALGALIQEERGVFLEINRPDLNLNRIIVMNDDDVIRVFSANERTDLKNGDLVIMVDGDIISN
jgi:hypothetical protein